MIGIGFLELLADLGQSEYSAELLAGMVTLRCVEKSLSPVGTTRYEIARVRHEIARLSDLPSRARLRSLVVLVDEAAVLDTSDTSLARALLAYGIELHLKGLYPAAIDVFSVVADYFRDDYDSRMLANHRKAFALRLAKQFDEALVAYDALEILAATHGDQRMQLEARLGRVKVSADTGDFGAARERLDEVLAGARRLQVNDLIGRCLIDRAGMAGIQGDHASAIIDAHAAIPYVTREESIERLQYNMAVAFRELRHVEAATRLADHLMVTAEGNEIRLLSVVLRLTLAIDGLDWVVADQLNDVLAGSSRSMHVETGYHEALCYAWARRGDFERAEIAARTMYEIASRAGMNEVASRALSKIADVRAGLLPTMYDFRPDTATAANEELAAVEERVLARIRDYSGTQRPSLMT